jgi:hypothetical protein
MKNLQYNPILLHFKKEVIMKTKLFRVNPVCFLQMVLIGVLIMVAILSFGCSKSPTTCDSTDTVKAVISTASDSFKEQLSAVAGVQPGMELSEDEWRLMRAGMEFSLQNISEQSFNKGTGERHCSADLIVHRTGAKETIPISYTTELQSSGELKVTVSGI